MRQNNYGFTFGGPVYIPGAYNGRNKTFFFFNFEQYLNNQDINNQTITVPIPEFRNGDFRRRRLDVSSAQTAGRQIVKERSTIQRPRPAPDGRLVRDPYQRTMIPSDRMDRSH